jgi:hypothetical protein
LAALHTYGGIVVRHTHYGPLDTHIDAMTFNSTDIAGGKRMTLHSITSVTHGEKTTVTVDGSCVTTTTATSTKRQCPDDVVTEVLNALKAFLDVKEPTPAQRAALRDLVSGFTTVGIDVSQTGGQWYVNPVRTTLDLSNGIYSHMQGNDLIEIIQYIRSNVGH